MTRRNAEQLDLLSYRPPSVPDVVLPEPVVERGEDKYTREVTWTAPEGTAMVAEDKAEFDRVVSEVEAGLEDAGIVSFLRHRAQRSALRSALHHVFFYEIYDAGDPQRLFEVTELSVRGVRHRFPNKPSEEEYGSLYIGVAATMIGLKNLRYTYNIMLGIRGGATAYQWKRGASRPKKIMGVSAYTAARDARY